MTQYQLWLLNDDYTVSLFLNKWTRLSYRIGLNQMCGASVDLMANDAKIADIDLMDRLRIVRDGVDIFGGLLQAEGWGISESVPQGDSYALDALDHAIYLDWRTFPRPAGQDYQSHTDHADDVAKDWVYYNAGAGATDVARRLADVAVAADAHACASVTKRRSGGVLLEDLIKFGAEQQFYWRMIPSASGCTFTTAFPLWGLDRTQGNGVNDELVFALDRRNLKQMSYRRDMMCYYNHMYVAGAGEGRDQTVVEYAVGSYGRRERWIPAYDYTATADLQAEGLKAIGANLFTMALTVVPAVGVLTPANLGDLCSIHAYRYGRTFNAIGIITAIDFEISADGVEITTPEMLAAPI